MVLNSPFSKYVLLIVFSACTSFVCSQTERFSVEEKVRWDVEKADSLATELPNTCQSSVTVLTHALRITGWTGLLKRLNLR